MDSQTKMRAIDGVAATVGMGIAWLIYMWVNGWEIPRDYRHCVTLAEYEHVDKPTCVRIEYGNNR